MGELTAQHMSTCQKAWGEVALQAPLEEGRSH